MADRRLRGMTGSDHGSRTTASRATAVAEMLHLECSILLDLYRKKESFDPDVSVPDGRLLSVPPPSSQLDARDKVWRIHSALLQCRSLLERAVTREEEELGGGKKGDYETQRKTVKDRLSLLLINTGELLKAFEGPAPLTPSSSEGAELNGPGFLFELKLWLHQIYKEVLYWSKTASTTFKTLPQVTAKERARTTRARRSTRSTRR